MPPGSLRVELNFFGHHPAALGVHLGPAMATHAVRHGAGLVLTLTHHGRIDLGSATAVHLGRHFFLATSGHNLDGIVSRESIHIVPTVGSREEWLPIVGLHTTRARGPGAPDVAWIELDPGAAASSGLEFVPLGALGIPVAPSASTAYCIHGLPAGPAARRSSPNGRIRLVSLGYLTRHASATDGVVTPWEVDLVLDYEDRPAGGASLSPLRLPAAHGMSGGGVWALPLDGDSHLWSAERVRLVGILRGWHRGQRQVSGVRISHWLRLVRDDFPDLRDLIDPILELAVGVL